MTLRPLGIDPGHCFIGGAWVPSHSGETLVLSNPSDGSTLCDIAKGNAADIDRAVQAAQSALDGSWGRLANFERGRILHQIGQGVLQHVETLAELEALDVGKPLKQARADVIALARYMGVTGHIIPWNYPMQIIGRSVGAALAMGNAAVLKPAEEACLTALAFAQIAHDAGLPAGALNVVPGLGAEAGAALTAHPGVNHISFTGSVGVGKLIQSAAAQHIVPVTLELGGKSPQLVFEDADVDAALPFLTNAGIQNAGQTCSASSRILVHRSRYDEVLSGMAARYETLRAGPAMDDLEVGPLVSQRQKEIVEAFLLQGADLECAARGTVVDDAPGGGAYVAPTLFAGVAPDHVLAQQEIFGPVQVVIPFETEEEAVQIANGTQYGLVASVWSQNGARQMRLAKRLRAGQVFLNNYGAGGGVELPFGGSGLSGHGREKGFEALYGFSTLKTVAALHG